MNQVRLERSELRVTRIAFGERAEMDPSKSKPLHLVGPLQALQLLANTRRPAKD